MGTTETAATIAGAATVAGVAIAGWWQSKLARQARAAEAAAPLTVVGTEYRALVTTLQTEVSRLRVELEALRADCDRRDGAAQDRIAQLEAQVHHLRGHEGEPEP